MIAPIFSALMTCVTALAWWLLYPDGALWPLYMGYTIISVCVWVWVGVCEFTDWLRYRSFW